MLNFLRVYRTLHGIVDTVEDGNEASFTTSVAGIKLDVDITKIPAIYDNPDSNTLVLNHISGYKLSNILIDNLIEGFLGTPVDQNVVILLPENECLNVNIKVTF